MKSGIGRIVPIAIGMALVLGCSTDNILSEEAQLKKDLAAIDKYLDNNGIVATEDVSGLRIIVHEAGSGVLPGGDAILTLKYKMSYLNGTVIKETANAVTLSFPLSDQIRGWQITFSAYIGKGGKATLYVPSVLGYGRAGSSRDGVPGNTNLVFEVELIGYTN